MPKVIVIGTSMGGLEALRSLVSRLPPDLPAAVLIVKHVLAHAPPLLAPILDRSGPLQVTTASDGEAIVAGRITVAPPGHHLLIADGRIRLTRGPYENHTRPAIDPLFRSAAVSCGPEAIGVILTGLLSDGASGLRAIKRCGGIAVVQDPADADYPDMPLAALAGATVDHRPSLAKMPALLDRLARLPAGSAVSVPPDIQAEVRIAEGVGMTDDFSYTAQPPAPFACPDCGGSLWNLEQGEALRFRCRVGHGFTGEALLASQETAIADALWAAVRAMQERAVLLKKLAEETPRSGASPVARSYQEKALESASHAETIRQFLVAKSDLQESSAPETRVARNSDGETGF